MRKLINLIETLNHVPWVTLGKIRHWNPGRLLARSRFLNLANPLPDLRIFSFSPSSTGQAPLWWAKQKKSTSLYGPCIDFEILIFQIPKAALTLKYLSFSQHTLFYQTTVHFFSLLGRLSTSNSSFIWLGKSLLSCKNAQPSLFLWRAREFLPEIHIPQCERVWRNAGSTEANFKNYCTSLLYP